MFVFWRDFFPEDGRKTLNTAKIDTFGSMDSTMPVVRLTPVRKILAAEGVFFQKKLG